MAPYKNLSTGGISGSAVLHFFLFWDPLYISEPTELESYFFIW